MATRWTSKHTGQKIDDTIDYVSNPNLLDNWYFGNPVNQRGQTSYTGNGYMIDRWYADEVVLAISSGAIRVSRSSVGQWYARIMQNLETELSKEIAGKTCTLSALVKSVSGIGKVQLSLFNISDNASTTNIYADLTGGIDLITLTFVVPESYSGRSLGVFFYPDVDDSHRSNGCDVYAVKLELGSQQTLAHQDADGNWVLNEIPDYGEQLTRCQRYYQVFDYTNAYVVVAFGYATEATVFRGLIPTLVAMRTKPTIMFTGASKSLNLCGNSSVVGVSSVTPSVINANINGIGINMSGMSITKNETYVLQAYGCKLELSADL